MKTLLVALFLFCLTLAARAQDWPRNLKTGKVEFAGVLPWPATAKTEAQRQALARQWYLAKLTDSTPAEVAKDVRTMVSKSLLTYAQLPVMSAIRQGEPINGYRLLYTVKLSSVKEGLVYSFSDFTISKRSEVKAESLESRLAEPTENEQAALAELRGRLVAATKGWR